MAVQLELKSRPRSCVPFKSIEIRPEIIVCFNKAPPNCHICPLDNKCRIGLVGCLPSHAYALVISIKTITDESGFIDEDHAPPVGLTLVCQRLVKFQSKLLSILSFFAAQHSENWEGIVKNLAANGNRYSALDAWRVLPEKLELTRFSGYKFGSTRAKEARNERHGCSVSGFCVVSTAPGKHFRPCIAM
ncbi:hypothetical protein TNCV_4412991 [Trichonephila clavipes]|nr:hypothetical protein TNCV_4412991 [Trichonephila clavipes]